MPEDMPEDMDIIATLLDENQLEVAYQNENESRIVVLTQHRSLDRLSRYRELIIDVIVNGESYVMTPDLSIQRIGEYVGLFQIFETGVYNFAFIPIDDMYQPYPYYNVSVKGINEEELTKIITSFKEIN